MTALQSVCPTFALMLVEQVLGSIPMGVSDVCINCMLPELWASRAQPWMQAAMGSFGFGAVVGPSLVGYYGFTTGYAILAVYFALPLMLLCVAQFFQVSTINYILPDDIANEFPLVDRKTIKNTSVSLIENIENKSTNMSPNDTVLSLDSTAPAVSLETPQRAKVFLFVYYMLYVGAEVLFAGWISTFAIRAGITSSNRNAAYLVALFYFAMTTGRFFCAVLSVYYSNTIVLRGSLLCSLMSCIVAILIAHQSYSNACISSLLVGFSMAPLFPSGFSIAADYKCLLSEATTTTAILGGAVGEMSIPVVIGIIMHRIGVIAMLYAMLAMILLITLTYCSLHWIFSRNMFSIGSHVVVPTQDN